MEKNRRSRASQRCVSHALGVTCWAGRIAGSEQRQRHKNKRVTAHDQRVANHLLAGTSHHPPKRMMPMSTTTPVMLQCCCPAIKKQAAQLCFCNTAAKSSNPIPPLLLQLVHGKAGILLGADKSHRRGGQTSSSTHSCRHSQQHTARLPEPLHPPQSQTVDQHNQSSSASPLLTG